MPTLIVIVLAGIYIGGIIKFWGGFHRTNFTQGKLQLALLWPVFFLANKNYRQNFNRALKG